MAAILRDPKALAAYLDEDPSRLHQTNARGQTLLHLCKTAPVARMLLARGASLNALDQWGSPPLRLACSREVAAVMMEFSGHPSGSLDGPWTHVPEEFSGSEVMTLAEYHAARGLYEIEHGDHSGEGAVHGRRRLELARSLGWPG